MTSQSISIMFYSYLNFLMLVSPMLAIDEAKDEDLDSFMNTISQRMDKGTKIKLKSKIIGLKKV